MALVYDRTLPERKHTNFLSSGQEKDRTPTGIEKMLQKKVQEDLF
jgi:hypothetical protein